ncbi:FIG00785302: hypothetical protein [hydrothermal vent metagenome]|uniref:Hydrazine synthase alpha subunit middle domain-containing protein n=1 Tax=hydrothermal vent metagenome TaxID=652676 RepID=A0A3B0YFW7_9ZZZZ
MAYSIFGGALTAHMVRLSAASLLLGLTACGGGGGSGGSGTLDPLVADFGIAYVRQPVPEEDTADIRDPASFTPGGQLIFRDLASPSASERNLTAGITGALGDVKDVEASFDGSKLVFALRLPDIENAAPEDQPTWNIWEYDIATAALNRVMQSDIQAENGQDVAPHYLADGRIIFSSTRQRTSKAILLDESKPQFIALDEDRNTPAFVLHTMEADGNEIKQVTFNQSHDLDPVVLDSGEVVFSRWDNSGPNSAVHLYKMNPDGTNLQLLYGTNSHETGTNGATVQFTQAREFPDGGVMALLKPFTGAFQGGDIIKIDTENYVDDTQTTAINQGILAGPAQASVAFGSVNSDNLPSPGGRFNSFYPFWDGTNRALITWSQCRLLENNLIVPCTADLLSNPNAVEAPPLYSVYLYDMDKQTQQPIFIPQEGLLYRDAVATQPRQLPTIISDGQALPNASFDFDPALINEKVGILNIRSVYDFDGSFNGLGATATDIETLANPNLTPTADDRPARFLRIVKPVSMPDRDLVNLPGTAFGRSSAQLMRDIIGYAPIEPDGSVRVKVPANIPFAISVLDKNGKRISQRHQNWLQLRPGEIMTCNGCHTANSDISHGRADLFPMLNSGAPIDGYSFNGSTIFGNFADSMAEARTRFDTPALDLSVDIVYADAWWTDAGGDPLDTAFEYRYADLDADTVDPAINPPLTPPVDPACLGTWTADCRITINYETHIHPIWNKDRTNGKCTDCHATVDDMGGAMVPAGQLDLSDGVDQQVVEHFKSYRELFFGDLAQSVDGNGQLIDQVQATDAGGAPLFQQASDANGNPLFKQVTDGAGDPLFVEATDDDVLLLDLNGDPALVPLFTDGVGNPLLVQDIDSNNNLLFDMVTGDPILIPAFTEGTDLNGDPLLIQDFDARGASLPVPVPRQAIDAAGVPMVDTAGDPVFIPILIPYMEPVLITVNVPQVMNVAGALASPRFFSIFEDPNNMDHFNTLQPSELKLIAEWLDIGGQYYNNPFDVPQ